MNKENKNAEISARIAEILLYTGDTRNGFAVKLGYERAQTVYDVMNMKSAPSYDFFRRFSTSEYSDTIDLKWLLSGEGSMLRDDHQIQSESLQSTVQQELSGEAAAYYRLYEKKDAEVGMLKEQIGALKAKLAQYESQPEVSKDNLKGLDSVKNASTKKPSSPNADNVISVTAP